MMTSSNDRSVSALLLDIEGTITSIDFVYQVLFPYARRQTLDFLRRHLDTPEVRADLEQLCEEHVTDLRRGDDPPDWPVTIDDSPEESPELPAEVVTFAAAYVHWLMDRDRKSTPLKSLQGKMWEEGYRAGELKSLIFADVPVAFERWRLQQKEIAIFSSGSVLAQKLLLAHTEAGDLTGFISRYFDTRVGAKLESGSYRRIAEELNLPPENIVFVSDVTRELEAARGAGMQPVLSIRPGNHPQPDPDSYRRIMTFDEL